MARWFALLPVPLVAAAALGRPQPAPVPYPEGYREWTHVKSMVILDGHPLADPFAGIHHVYANARALEGLRTGSYPDGAVLVFDLLEAAGGEAVYTEGSRKLVGVMHRDAGQYAATGGWGFEGFAGDSRTQRLTTDGGASCYACHQGQAVKGYVFSAWRK
ncbi:MAG: cytochrome P460 family protein [Gemmatimonadota bacterium]|nr:cytochrome P460 family protein [Gemmatimonadota bacterium]